jgi:YD repeat-containing protein
MNYRTSSYNSFTDETRGYNTQYQLTSLTSGSLSATYNYPTGTNNGKISSSVINGETVTYLYDSLNRMIQATSSAGWGETYGFDGFGNLTTKPAREARRSWGRGECCQQPDSTSLRPHL